MKQERLYKVILAPHVSEKTALATEKNNVYTFEVARDANELEVRSAVESLFSVKVKDVRLLNVKARTKFFKGQEGKRQGWKKAYVTLQADQTLNFAGA